MQKILWDGRKGYFLPLTLGSLHQRTGDKSFLPSPRPFLLEPRPPVIHYYLDLPDNLRAVLLACSAVYMDRYPPIASVTNNIVNSS